jgi:hypothetical protein
MRGFYAAGAAVPILVLILSVPLGGSALAKHAFQVGMGVFLVTNFVVFLLCSTGGWRPGFAVAHVVITGFGLLK